MSAGQPCPECGFDVRFDLDALLARCTDVPATTRALLERSAMPHRRPAPGVWSPIEYAAHLAEAVRWYAARVRLVLGEDDARLEPHDFDAAAEAGRYAARSVDEVVDDLAAAGQELRDLAASLDAADLERAGRGSEGTPRSVATLLARAHHELVHHELDLRRGLPVAGP